MKKVVKLAGRAVGAACTILLIANFNAFTSAIGLDRLAANHTFLGALAATITSRAAKVVALIGFGVALWTAFDWLARWWDEHHPSADERLRNTWPELSEISDAVGNELQSGVIIPSMGLAARVAAKYTTLNRLGVACPGLIPGQNGRYWFAMTRLFLEQIWPVLREGHVSEARQLAQQFTNAVANASQEHKAQVEQELAQQFGGGLPN